MSVNFIESAGPLLAVLTPLVAVPLTVITFYLRSLREHQVTWQGDMLRRIEANETVTHGLRARLSEFERDYASKEEWLRESIGAKHQLERVKEAVIRMQTLIEVDPPDVGARSPVRGQHDGARRDRAENGLLSMRDRTEGPNPGKDVE
jgi:hypothetical protein